MRRPLIWILLAAAAATAGEPDLARLVDGGDAAYARELAERSDLPLDDLLRAARALRPAAEAERGQRTQRVDLVVEGKREPTAIVTYVPERVDPAKPAPALLYLHGSGGSGEEAPGLWRSTADALGMIVVAPTDAIGDGGYGFSARERGAALAALRWARRRFNIDEDRIHLTGVSRGGHMAWDLAARHPDRWASVSPMIGGPRWLPQRGQDNLSFLENVAHLPIRDLQGEQDQKGLLDNLRYAFRKLERLEAPDARLITFADLGHSFRMEAVDWPAFLKDAKRTAVPPRVVLCCTGPARAAWVEAVATDRTVQETFTPKVDGRTWPTLDAMGQRAYMDALVAEKTARIEARWLGKGKFEMRSRGVRRLRLLLAPGMFDPEEAVVVVWNGRSRKKRVKASARVLLDDFADRFDRSFVPVAELAIP